MLVDTCVDCGESQMKQSILVQLQKAEATGFLASLKISDLNSTNKPS